VASAVDTGAASDRLQALGLDLPSLGDDSTYVNHRAVNSSIYISGQLPYKDGELLGQGVVGRDIEVQTARGLARQAALNALAVAAQAVGDLDRVRIVQMLVFVASTPELGEQSRVADAPVISSSRCWARTDGTRAPRSVSPGCRGTVLSRSRWSVLRCRSGLDDGVGRPARCCRSRSFNLRSPHQRRPLPIPNNDARSAA
jgi:enamine deaminase RidA (YjgF/YER057c/UK114 family)